VQAEVQDSFLNRLETTQVDKAVKVKKLQDKLDRQLKIKKKVCRLLWWLLVRRPCFKAGSCSRCACFASVAAPQRVYDPETGTAKPVKVVPKSWVCIHSMHVRCVLWVGGIDSPVLLRTTEGSAEPVPEAHGRRCCRATRGAFVQRGALVAGSKHSLTHWCVRACACVFTWRTEKGEAN